MVALVTGATGFTGSYVVPLLLERGYSLRCLKRPGSDRSRLPAEGIEWVTGDLGDERTLRQAMEGADLLVNIASLGFGHAPQVVRAARAAKIRRAVFISTTAIFTTLKASSKTVRKAAEEEIRTSGLNYTILRPTMIFGSSRDRNMCRLVRYLRRFPFMPILGDGEKKQQPVYVGDVARAVVDCLAAEPACGRAYNIPGRESLSFNEVIERIGRLLSRKILKVHLPEKPFVAMLNTFEKMRLPLPIKAEQVLRLNEDKVFGFEDAARDFSYKPRTFREGMILQLQEMGLLDARPSGRVQ